MLPNERVEYDQELATLRREMNEQKIEFSWSNGRSMAMEQAIEFALVRPE
jgi:hypothetical protein